MSKYTTEELLRLGKEKDAMDFAKTQKTELKPCICGSDDISTYEERYFFFSNNAFIKCNKCDRLIEKRTLKEAIKAWDLGERF